MTHVEPEPRTPSGQCLAFDFGASSGRLMLGRLIDGRIELTELHRFPNDPVAVRGTLYWDVLRLFHEIKQGLIKAKAVGAVDSIGIDTWGVDFGLIDADGNLLDNPVHYRDVRTQGIMEEAWALVPRDEMYQRAGIQFMSFNSVFQLLAIARQRPELLRQAACLLHMPDLLAYFMTGIRQSEYTIASTGQMLDARLRIWDEDVLRRLGLPTALLAPLVAPGTRTGNLSAEICEELGIAPVPLIAVTSHDTASAVVAVPAAAGEDFMYISSGTWSLQGIESPAPLIDAHSFAANFTNEGGYGGTTRFLKNIMGLWLIQESRRQWLREGIEVSYADLEREALASPAFVSLIDPDDGTLTPPGDMPSRIRALCLRTDQPEPQTRGAVMRCVYESLALKYRLVKDQIESITGRRYRTLHVVGGGTKDGLLSQFTANACGVPVIAGPIEATALGNIAVQLIALGLCSGLAEARSLIAASTDLKRYQPADENAWQRAMDRYRQIMTHV